MCVRHRVGRLQGLELTLSRVDGSIEHHVSVHSAFYVFLSCLVLLLFYVGKSFKTGTLLFRL